MNNFQPYPKRYQNRLFNLQIVRRPPPAGVICRTPNAEAKHRMYCLIAVSFYLFDKAICNIMLSETNKLTASKHKWKLLNRNQTVHPLFGARHSAFRFCKIPLPDHHRPFYTGALSGILFSFWIPRSRFLWGDSWWSRRTNQLANQLSRDRHGGKIFDCFVEFYGKLTSNDGFQLFLS